MNKSEKFKSHTGETIEKPWGWEFIVEHNEYYTVKILHVNAGHRMSLQYHNEKTETAYVLKGSMRNWKSADDTDFDVYMAGTSLHVSPGQIHRFGATEAYDVEILECSRSMLDDVERLADDYNR